MSDQIRGNRPALARCEEMRRVVKTDLALRVPFHVDPNWYDAHWYGALTPAKSGYARRALHQVWCQLLVPTAARMSRGTLRMLGRIDRRTAMSAGADVSPSSRHLL
jgi:hypothetical protein